MLKMLSIPSSFNQKSANTYFPFRFVDIVTDLQWM